MYEMRTVLVTGGTRGIGRAIAEKFLQKGARVVVTYSKDEESALSAKEKGLEVIKADVSKEEDVLKVFSNIKSLDVLVNNAGVSLIKQIQDTTLDEFERIFSVNVRGAFLCSREATKLMLKNKQGLIVNVSSVWGELGASCESVYSASKSALIGFTKALAKELGYSGIRVNCVSPGMIDTTMNDCFSQTEKDEIAKEILLQRLGRSEEVADAVLFLYENEYVTGIDLPVGGGFGF